MELLTVQETAHLLRVSPITVRRYIAAGRLAAVRVGRGVRVRREALEAFVAPVIPPHLRDDPDDDLTIPEGRPLTRNDSLFKIIGLAGSDDPDEPTSDIASDKYANFAEMYASREE